MTLYSPCRMSCGRWAYVTLSPVEQPYPIQTSPPGEQPLMHQTITPTGAKETTLFINRAGYKGKFQESQFPNSAKTRSQALNWREGPVNRARPPSLQGCGSGNPEREKLNYVTQSETKGGKEQRWAFSPSLSPEQGLKSDHKAPFLTPSKSPSSTV